ncbi:hypothetical protein [Gemmata sp.]|uniref:hypothetical protein n=1 Tax=Gemmata sp. TaxID=1914242 RepID=UPI003F6EBFE7
MLRASVVAVLAFGLAAHAQPQKVKAPEGWKEVRSEAKDFAVLLPEESDESRVEEKEQVSRGLTATKGDARFTVKVFTERKGGRQKEDYLKVVPNDIDVVKGSIKKVKLGTMDGLEYQKKEADKTVSTYRVYRSKDGATMVTLIVFNSDKLKADEKAAFLDSFRITEPKQ